MLNPDIINPFYAHLFRSVERTASAAGYDVILCNTEESSARFRHIVETLAEGHVDGLLIATAQETDPAIEWLRERKLPYVLLNRSRKAQSDPWVGSNDIQTGWLGGNHLARLGHRRIALLTGPPTHNMLGARGRVPGGAPRAGHQADRRADDRRSSQPPERQDHRRKPDGAAQERAAPPPFSPRTRN